MARNLGRIRIERVEIEGRPYGVPYAAGTATFWSEHTGPEVDGMIYLAVRDDGLIITAGPDPSWNLIEGLDIVETEGTDWRAVIGKYWNGEEIVDAPADG